MIKRILRIAAIAAITTFALAARAQDSGTAQTQYPIIMVQPEDNCVLLGNSVTFTVAATNVDSYQWYDNNVAIDGQTNSTLTISSAAISDVGYYTAVAIKGEEWVPSRAANFNVYTVSRPVNNLLTTTASSSSRLLSSATSSLLSPLAMGDGSSITIYGMPVSGSGSSGTCPGSYSGCVNFTKTTSQGWGWAPSTNALLLSVADLNRTNTVVAANGKSLDSYCAETTAFIDVPAPSTKYRFAVYFPPGAQIPTNTYSLTLTGFDP